MKQKTHSGTKKRIKVRKSGKVSAQKSCKNHLLTNKSAGQKKKGNAGYEVSQTRMMHIRRLLPGMKIKLGRPTPAKEVVAAEKPAKKAAVKPAAEKVAAEVAAE